MTNRTRNIVIAAGIAVVCVPALGAGAFLWTATATPTMNRLPLADELISLDIPQGQQMLKDASNADYEPLNEHFESQERRAWCGVASSVIVENALTGDGDLQQSDLFTPEVEEVTSYWGTTLSGMTVSQLGGLLQARGHQAQVVHAGDSSVDSFREEAKDNLVNAGDYVLINYYRPGVKQEGGGHISPLGAYHEETDRFLVLDVTTTKYPPVWVQTEMLFNAMNTVDSASGQTRGYVFVSSASP